MPETNQRQHQINDSNSAQTLIVIPEKAYVTDFQSDPGNPGFSDVESPGCKYYRGSLALKLPWKPSVCIEVSQKVNTTVEQELTALACNELVKENSECRKTFVNCVLPTHITEIQLIYFQGVIVRGNQQKTVCDQSANPHNLSNCLSLWTSFVRYFNPCIPTSYFYLSSPSHLLLFSPHLPSVAHVQQFTSKIFRVSPTLQQF